MASRRGNSDPSLGILIAVSLVILYVLIKIWFYLILIGIAGLIIWLIILLARRRRDTGSMDTGLASAPDLKPSIISSEHVGSAVTTLSEPTLPLLNYFHVSEGTIDRYWSIAFYDNLGKFIGNSVTSTGRWHGLIYYFIIDGNIRYIGQTRETTLRWRMTRRQDNDLIGYNYAIKRNMLIAASKGKLSIKTKRMLKTQLDSYEKAEIETYAVTNRLWNQEHNKYFQPENFYE